MHHVLLSWLRRGLCWLPAVLLAVPALAQVDNYQFTPTAGTFGPLPATATAVAAVQADDAVSGALPLGFAFVYDGTAFTSAYASSNGFLSFNATTTSDLNNDLSGVGNDNVKPLAAPFWDDLDGREPTARAGYLTTGAAPNRVFTFEWLNWKRYGFASTGGPSLSFQVKLYETSNRVEFIYRPEAGALGASAAASIGLAGAVAGNNTTFVSLDGATAAPTASTTTETDNIGAVPAAGQVYAFVPAPPAACPVPRGLSATVVSPTSATLRWSVAGGTGPYTVQYGPTGFNPALPSSGTNAYTTQTGITGLSTTVSGLAGGAVFQFYVTQNCGGPAGSSVRSGAGVFVRNDECAGAVALPVAATCAAPTSGSLLGASQSLPPTAGCGFFVTNANDVWFSFVAAATSQAVSVATGTDAVVELRSGTCTSSAAVSCFTTASGTPRTALVGGLTAGQAYFLRVYASGFQQPTGAATAFTICVAAAPAAPANDDCAGALPLPVQFGLTCQNQTTGDNSAATDSGPPAPTCASYQGGDLWYALTIPVGGSVTVSTDAPTAGSPITDTGLSIYSGTCTNLVEIACDDDSSPNGLFSQIALTGRTPGEVVYVRVWAFGGNNAGLLALCALAPGNCAVPTGLAATLVTPSTARLSWVASVPPVAGATYDVEFGLQGFVPGTGTRLNSTATVANISGLVPVSDYCFYVRQNCGGTNGSSVNVGPVCFSTPQVVPLNDEPCGAVALGNGAAVTSANVGATTSLQNGIVLPACSPAAAPKDVWFRFDAAQPTSTLALTGTAAGMVRVFSAADCANGPFVAVGCASSGANNVGVPALALTGLVVGRRYYVAVSGYGSSNVTGSFTLGATNVLASRAPADPEALRVYPNPSGTGQLTLRLAPAAGPRQATLFNALGQCVVTETLTGGGAEHTLSTRALPAGLYTLRVQQGGQVLTRKVVLE